MQSTTRFLCLGALLLFTSCALPGQKLTRAALEINATIPDGDVVLSGGDVIDITFPNKDEWSASVSVRPDGKASFPFLDDVEVSGRTTAQLDELLTSLYEPVLEAPEVSLNISAWGSREVVVMGQVRSPGPVIMSGPRMTLVEAIGRAGGYDRRTALMKQVVLVRFLKDPGNRKAWKIDARPERWDNSTPILLQPRDIIYVPNSPIDEVNIWVDQYIRQMIPVPQIIPGSI